MHISAPALRVLTVLFRAGSSTLSRPRLARHTALDQPALTAALNELTQLGLIDPRRLRLTLPGLAIAAASSSRAQKRPRRPAAREARRPSSPIALFSHREPPRAVA